MKTMLSKWVLPVIPATIMLQTLYFKFTGQPESIYIFSTLGVEPWGRIGSGAVELVACVLLFFPRTTFFGAAIAALTMIGAIASHVAVLGIEVMNDGGLLFAYACIVLVTSLMLLYINRGQLSDLRNRLAGARSGQL